MSLGKQTKTAGAISFIKSQDGELPSLMLAACLSALGVSFSEKPSFRVMGDVTPCVNWLFDDKSLDGKFSTAEMIRKWEDKVWITSEGNEHPMSYLAAAMQNLITLICHHMGDIPRIELVKKGRKTLIVPEGTNDHDLGLLIKKFTRK